MYQNQIILEEGIEVKRNSRIIDGKWAGHITGGRKRDAEGYVKSDPIPWQVAILDRNSNTRVNCGGVLLSSQIVLSAAHNAVLDGCPICLVLDGTDRVLIGSNIEGGISNMRYIHTLSSRYEIHPKYQVYKHELIFLVYDFILLWLETRLNYCPSVYARLPPPAFNDDFLIDKMLTASGWGSEIRKTKAQLLQHVRQGTPHTFKRRNRLMFIDVPYLPSRICQRRYQVHFQGYPVSSIQGVQARDIDFQKEPGASMLCTSICTKENWLLCPLQDKSTCKGDSGGLQCHQIPYPISVFAKYIFS